MARMTIVWILTCLAAAAWAQEGAPPPEPSARAVARLGEIEKEVDELIAAWRVESTRVREEHAAEAERAKAEDRPVPALPKSAMRPDFSPVVDKLIAWADEAEGEDSALYLTQAVRYDGSNEGRGHEALERLIENHPQSPTWARLGPLLSRLVRSFEAEQRERLVEVLTANPDPDVRGWGALLVHAEVVEKAPLDSDRYRTAKAALLAARELAKDTYLKGELSAPIDLREKLAVGVVSPDIEGLDLDGEAFKLSDYRGKVILVSFWGDW